MLITNAGKRPVTDRELRAGSLQAAVRFANQWGLAGVVLAADAFVMCPQLAAYVKSRGLVCGSYGPLNNVPGNVEVSRFVAVRDLPLTGRGFEVLKITRPITDPWIFW